MERGAINVKFMVCMEVSMFFTLIALSWFESTLRVIFSLVAPCLHAQPKGMRCIEAALRYSLVSSISRS